MRRGVILLAVLFGSCAHHPVTPPDPNAIEGYLVPFGANPDGLVCAETAPNIPHNYCMTVRAFRLAVLPSVYASR